jgi:hypothetical protein
MNETAFELVHSSSKILKGQKNCPMLAVCCALFDVICQ